MSRTHSKPPGTRLSLWLGGASLAFLIFFRITRELIEGDVIAFDSSLLQRVATWRTPWLTATAVDVTALGSVTLVILFSAISLLVLLALRDRTGALHLLAASAGGGILTFATKDTIERVRPAQAQQLISVSGFSYPSGHSVLSCALYLTIAIIGAHYVSRTSAKAVIMLVAAAVILMVGASRIYLGVHYPTDVISGFSLGAAWALLLARIFARLSHQK